MPIRDEKIFSDEEMIAAFAVILPPEQAREEGMAMNALPGLHDFGDATRDDLAAAPAIGPRTYSRDLLDMLSLVSDSCAERAWRLMLVSPEEGERRLEEFRRRVDEACRAQG